MRLCCKLAVLCLPLLLLATPVHPPAAPCPSTVERVTQITKSAGTSQTARGNERCIGVDPTGRAHMVWEDYRDGNFQIYYASIIGDSVSPEVRLTRLAENSNFPCVACYGENVYILWQETIIKTPETCQICYVRIAGGKEEARSQITTAALGANCPASAVGPDGALHVAWHQGVGNLTTIHYGKIVGDSVVARAGIATQHPGASRPDIACDSAGRILIVWFEGTQIKSRLWNGTAWQPELVVADNKSKAWRMSLCNLSENSWALAWFDQASKTTDVWASFFDGTAWHDETRVNTGQTGFYPATAHIGEGTLIVTWEDQDKAKGEYMLMMRCFDGGGWGQPSEITRGRAMSRYASLAPAGDSLHLIWFGSASGNNQIFHGLLRR
jgi:hypothetical protein